MNQTTRRKKIALMGPFGGGNLGDAAIQEAMIQHIYRYWPAAEIYGISLYPQDTLERHQIAAYPIRKQVLPDASPRGPAPSNPGVETKPELLSKLRAGLKRIPVAYRYLKSCREACLAIGGGIWRRMKLIFEEIAYLKRSYSFLKGFEMLVVSGGGQLDDSWGGPWEHPYALFSWAVLAKLTRTRYVFVSVGADKIETTLGRWFIKKALSMANYHSYRDNNSKKMAEKIGVRSGNYVYPDLAFSLEMPTFVRHNNQSATQKIIGVSPMAYCDPRVWRPKRDAVVFEKYIKSLATFVRWLLERGNIVWIIQSHARMDRFAIQHLKEIVLEKNASIGSYQFFVPNIGTVRELIAHLSQIDLLVASRFHGVALSLLVNRPVLALSYELKINALMQDLKLSDYCLNIDQIDCDSLIERFSALENERELIESRLIRQVAEYRAALEKQYDRVLGEDVEMAT